MPTPFEDTLRASFNLLEKHVETKYGIPIRIRDVPNPFTGDLDGAEIHGEHARDDGADGGLLVVGRHHDAEFHER